MKLPNLVDIKFGDNIKNDPLYQDLIELLETDRKNANVKPIEKALGIKTRFKSSDSEKLLKEMYMFPTLSSAVSHMIPLLIYLFVPFLHEPKFFPHIIMLVLFGISVFLSYKATWDNFKLSLYSKVSIFTTVLSYVLIRFIPLSFMEDKNILIIYAMAIDFLVILCLSFKQYIVSSKHLKGIVDKQDDINKRIETAKECETKANQKYIELVSRLDKRVNLLKEQCVAKGEEDITDKVFWWWLLDCCDFKTHFSYDLNLNGKRMYERWTRESSYSNKGNTLDCKSTITVMRIPHILTCKTEEEKIKYMRIAASNPDFKPMFADSHYKDNIPGSTVKVAYIEWDIDIADRSVSSTEVFATDHEIRGKEDEIRRSQDQKERQFNQWAHNQYMTADEMAYTYGPNEEIAYQEIISASARNKRLNDFIESSHHTEYDSDGKITSNSDIDILFVVIADQIFVNTKQKQISLDTKGYKKDRDTDIYKYYTDVVDVNLLMNAIDDAILKNAENSMLIGYPDSITAKYQSYILHQMERTKNAKNKQ